MAEKRQKKQAVKAFEKETFSKDKEVTGVKHIEHRQDNTFSVENQFSASEKPVSNLPRDANHGSRTGKATSGHSVQKSEFNTGTEYRKNNKKKYYRQQQQDTSGHNVQKSEAEAEKTFLKENSFINEENGKIGRKCPAVAEHLTEFIQLRLIRKFSKQQQICCFLEAEFVRSNGFDQCFYIISAIP